MQNLITFSTMAAEYIKSKLQTSDGKAVVTSVNGKTYEIHMCANGKAFTCRQLPIKPPYEFTVFNVIVDLLVSQGGTAEKGNGRSLNLAKAVALTRPS